MSGLLGSSTANGASGLPIVSSENNMGFFSPMAKIYMVDVIDHLENAVSSLDQFIGTCEHLTDYVFVSLPRLDPCRLKQVRMCCLSKRTARWRG